jgi:UDP-N-acetylmuramoyl-L-alanyl-D-glutamate--2,6-diaminopimelate ligase
VKLSDLMAGTPVRLVAGGGDIEIAGLAYDSRTVKPGDLFFSTARDAAQSRVNTEQALNRGARAAVVRGWDGAAARPAEAIYECERPRMVMGVAASRFYGAPSRAMDLIGITGTSGKTTTTYLLSSIFAAAELQCGIIGTIGIFAGGRKIYSGLTTPESIDFEAALAAMAAAGVSAAAAEISSIGLDERRVDELSFRACLFTNLGRDHLDYHGAIENYFAAKLRLFTEILPRGVHPERVAIAHGGDPFGRRVLEAAPGRKLSFGLDPRFDVHAASFAIGVGGIRARVMAPGGAFDIESPLLGEINLLNILGACAVSVALGIETDAVVEGVRRCPGAPGRLEAVAGPAGVKVLVDYAHKPDALEAVLRALRGLNPGKLICVFGCGGDRDRGKRPLMGGIAARMADVPVLTSDNPRGEDPSRIIAEVEAGLANAGLKRVGESAARAGGGYLAEPDRRAAIAAALRIACPGDIVVIAGKGHEDYQLVGGRRLDFDDRVVVRELVAAMSAV